ncbi:MAG: AAA family ATPase, partial [Flavobacteriales bacterium]
MEDFSPGESIRDEATPIDREVDPMISVTFELSVTDLEDIYPEFFDRDNFNEEKEVTIVKRGRREYNIDDFESAFTEFDAFRNEVIGQVDSVADEWIVTINDNDSIGSIQIEEKLETIEKLRHIENYLNSILTSQEDGEGIENETIDFIESMLEDVESSKEKINQFEDIESKIESNIVDKIPEFVLFSTYEDTIPNEVPIDELHNNEFIQDLAKISDLDPSVINRGNPIEQRSHKKDVNIQLNEDYEQFWTQDAADLTVDWTSDTLYFWIEEDDQPYPPSLRSEGRLWHLSFYIKLSAHASADTPPIILIDDPGLHLHAKAQEDILNKLEDVSTSSKVIYTTHSPYLIDTQKLNRVWLVNKTDSQGSTIEKLHAGADKDTLRPVLTAIGADTTIGLQLDKENQIVVEGISDYHYLQAFREILDWDYDLEIIPGVGGNTPVYIGSILFGWGVDPIFCLDPDDPHENARKLREELGIECEKIVYVHDGNGAIEDIFNEADFKEYV